MLEMENCQIFMTPELTLLNTTFGCWYAYLGSKVVVFEPPSQLIDDHTNNSAIFLYLNADYRPISAIDQKF